MVRNEKQKKQTHIGLPIVSNKTVDAIHHVYENPHLVKFIESQIGKYPQSTHTAMFEVVIGTLTVMEHQFLVDKKDSNLSTDKTSL